MPWLYVVGLGKGSNGGRETIGVMKVCVLHGQVGIATFTFVISFKYDETVLLNALHQQRPTGPRL